MLRQVFVFKGMDILYQQVFGQAYDSETIDLVKSKLKEFIEDPIEGQVFNRPLFEYQAVYGAFRGIFFLVITDLADRPDTVKKELSDIAAKFHEFFPDPQEIQTNTGYQQEFIGLLKELHASLHPKITLAGPQGSGRTTIAQLLRDATKEERTIMNFANVYPVSISGLEFDMWDFILDDFSPLWNNYLRGSDIVLFVCDSQEENLSKLTRFSGLQLRESKYSKCGLIANFQDQDNILSPESIGDKYKMPAIGMVATDTVDARDRLESFLIELLDLKRKLPAKFKTLLIQANTAIQEEKFENALDNLRELANIAMEYNEPNYVKTFEQKIVEIEAREEERKRLERIEKRKIQAPEKIKFESGVNVKTLGLPKASPLPQTASVPKPTSAVPSPPKTSHPVPTAPLSSATVIKPHPPGGYPENSQSLPPEPPIKPSPAKMVSIQAPSSDKIPQNFFQQKMGGQIETPSVTGFQKYLPKPPKILSPKLPARKPTPKPYPSGSEKAMGDNFSNQEEAIQVLQEEIIAQGDTLDLIACAKFVEKMAQKLKRLPTRAEIQKTARVFVAKRKGSGQ